VTTRTDVLIVGGSVAGLRTAEALRRLSYAGTVTILEASGDLPYDRTALSKKVLHPDHEARSVDLRTQEALDQAGIEVRLRSRAASLDPKRHTVTLANGEVIEYSTLVIATGAEPRELPNVARPSVHYLRTWDDAVRLRRAMESIKRAVVVGAGFIGSEVAAAMTERGIDVTVVEPAGYPLARVLGDIVGARLAQLHARQGIRLVPGRAVDEVQVGAGGAQDLRVVLDDGTTIDTELVVVGIGAIPHTAWLDGSGVVVADGVICDEFCRTSVPDVYAVGDVCRWPNPLFEESMRVEHWTNAIEQALVVGANIVDPGAPRAYAPVPYVWSDQYGSRLQIVGRPRPGDDVQIVVDDPDKLVLVALYAREGRFVAAFTLNAPTRAIALRKSLAAGSPLSAAIAAVA
jgi:NADPH-dependent 2,4-dienoyl-CoA reductase/sulfur reductase-like enzyme